MTAAAAESASRACKPNPTKSLCNNFCDAALRSTLPLSSSIEIAPAPVANNLLLACGRNARLGQGSFRLFLGEQRKRRASKNGIGDQIRRRGLGEVEGHLQTQARRRGVGDDRQRDEGEPPMTVTNAKPISLLCRAGGRGVPSKENLIFSEREPSIRPLGLQARESQRRKGSFVPACDKDIRVPRDLWARRWS